MKVKKIIFFLPLVIGLSLGAFYGVCVIEASAQTGEISHYTCGMHPSVNVSPKEYKGGNTQCPICHMNLTPVYKEEPMAQSRQKKMGERRILFYRNPMNPDITSKVPAKDEMGMDYIPVYEESGMSDMSYDKDIIRRVKIKLQETKLAGIVAEPATRQHLFKKIRTVGTVAYDPSLAIAQDEFLGAVRTLQKVQEGKLEDITERSQLLVESAKRKLNLLGLSPQQIEGIETSGKTQTNLILPEETMWIYGEVYEYELPWIKVGERINVSTASLPGEEFSGTITSVNPTVNSMTRSITFRAQVENPGKKLKPDMYVDVMIESMYMSPEGEHMVVAIPKEALLDTGERKIVWVDNGNGEYVGKAVQVGPEAIAVTDGESRAFYPVLSGIHEGEKVVTNGNFLIDSQSQITGVAAAAYGGALGSEEGSSGDATQHQH